MTTAFRDGTTRQLRCFENSEVPGNQAQAVRTRVRRGPRCDPHGIRPPLPVTMSETVASPGPVPGWSALVVSKPSNRCAGVAAYMPLTSSAATKSAQPEERVAWRPQDMAQFTETGNLVEDSVPECPSGGKSRISDSPVPVDWRQHKLAGSDGKPACGLFPAKRPSPRPGRLDFAELGFGQPSHLRKGWMSEGGTSTPAR